MKKLEPDPSLGDADELESIATISSEEHLSQGDIKINKIVIPSEKSESVSSV